MLYPVRPHILIISKERENTGLNGAGAVSYTHLDVYKRQGYNRPAHMRGASASHPPERKHTLCPQSKSLLRHGRPNFIQPKLLAGSLQVKPFWVIFGILLGGGLFGVFGIFLAVPIVALLRSILLDIFDLKERKMKERATIENTLSENKNTDIKKDEPE